MLKETLNQFEETLRGRKIVNVRAQYHRLDLTCEDGGEIIIKSELAKEADLGCCLLVFGANVIAVAAAGRRPDPKRSVIAACHPRLP